MLVESDFETFLAFVFKLGFFFFFFLIIHRQFIFKGDTSTHAYEIQLGLTLCLILLPLLSLSLGRADGVGGVRLRNVLGFWAQTQTVLFLFISFNSMCVIRFLSPPHSRAR